MTNEPLPITDLWYKAKFDEHTEVDFTLKWAHEVEVENRMKGNAVALQISGKF